LREHLRSVPDFPTPGITFFDITPLLGDAGAFAATVDALAARWGADGVDKVVGIEARGFIFAAPVAHTLRAGFVPVRKPGKLPWQTVTETYELEYGQDQLAAHADAVVSGDRVLVVDDVLATGGTAAATCRLLERLGAEVVGVSVVLELGFLHGRARLGDREIHSLLVEQ
jgi:adenine phosphoribosyltransferase